MIWRILTNAARARSQVVGSQEPGPQLVGVLKNIKEMEGMWNMSRLYTLYKKFIIVCFLYLHLTAFGRFYIQE
jgi:hypothetical protein